MTRFGRSSAWSSRVPRRLPAGRFTEATTNCGCRAVTTHHPGRVAGQIAVALSACWRAPGGWTGYREPAAIHPSGRRRGWESRGAWTALSAARSHPSVRV